MTTRQRLRRWVLGSCLGLGIAAVLLYGLTVPPCSALEPHKDASPLEHRTYPSQRSVNPLDPSVAPTNWQHQPDRAATASQCDDLTWWPRSHC